VGRSSLQNEGFTILALFGVLFLASVDNQLLIPILPVLSDDLDVSLARLGELFSLYAFCAALFNLFFGPLSDRLGRVLFLRLGLSAFAILAALTTQIGGFAGLAAIRACTGVAAGLLSTCTVSYIGDCFPYAKRGRVMGIVLSSYFAALILGVPLSSWIAEAWGWRRIFVVTGILAVLLLVAALRISSDRPKRRLVSGSSFRSYLGFVSRRQTLGALVTSFLVSGATLAFLTFISGYLASTFALSTVQISMVFLVSGGAAILASPVSGWISDQRWTKKRLFVVANSLLALPLILLVQVGGGAALFAVIFLAGLLVAFRQTSLQTLQTELIGSGDRGSFLALRNCASQLGIAVSVLIAGSLYGTYGYGAVTLFAASLTLAGSAMLYFFVEDPQGDRPDRGIASAGS
jgi:predicted MFS family arabinose efflux permease